MAVDPQAGIPFGRALTSMATFEDMALEIHAMQRIASLTFRLGLAMMVFVIGLLAFLTTTTIENRIQIAALQQQAKENRDRIEVLAAIRVDIAEIKQQLRGVQAQLDAPRR